MRLSLGLNSSHVKILYFHQHFSTPKGASGTRSYEIASRMAGAGHEVVIACGSYDGGDSGLDQPFVRGQRRGNVGGFQVVEFELPYSNSDGFLRRAVTFLRFAFRSVWLALTESFEVVFATSTPLTAALPGIAARWLRGKPFVFEVRDLWPELPREMGVIRNPVVLGLLSGLEWVSYRSAHRLVALSPGIAEGIKRRGVEENRVALVPNGCDLGLFSAPSVVPKRPAGVRQDELIAVFAGTHGRANGLDQVLDAALELRRRGEDKVRLVLAGEGSEKAQLIARAEEHALGNVLFLDRMPKQELAELLHGADLGLQCLKNVPAFYFGTSPNKFFDYLAAGLPVLINYPGWLAEVTQDVDCGFVVEPDNPRSFADALQVAARDRAALARKAEAAASLARDRYSRDALTDRWIDWVTGVVDE